MDSPRNPARDPERRAANPSGAARRPTILERLSAGGILRSGSPKRGFRYRGPGGRRVSRADLLRIAELRIPPAWTDVAISTSAHSPVQAVGRDAAGRWQYLYHRRHVARRERLKQKRLIRFILALPGLRRRVNRDLRLPGLPREKVLAGVLTVLSTCFLRPGNQEYAEKNGSFGIATLRKGHVGVRGDRVWFDFTGKSGRQQQHELRDRRIATLMRAMLEHPGEVFKFRNEAGDLVDLHTRHINDYIREVMGERFSAKDFRTWAANLLCAHQLALAHRERGATPRQRRRQVTAAVNAVAERLGNTPAVCRASYIFDCVLEGYEAGRVMRNAATTPPVLRVTASRGLVKSERALVALLRNGLPAAARP